MDCKSKNVALLLFLMAVALIAPLHLANSQTQLSQITIRADGSIAGTDRIRQNGNIYTLTGNLSSPITIERDNIVLDGAGFTLQGSGKLPENSCGVTLSGHSQIVIENLSIIGCFNDAIFLNKSKNCLIQGNKIWGNNNQGISINNSCEIWANQNSIETTAKFAIYAYGSNQTLFTENKFDNNFGGGLYIIGNNYANHVLYPLNTVISNNVLTNNSRNLAGYSDIILDGSNSTVIGNILLIDNAHVYNSAITIGGNNNLVARNNITKYSIAVTYFGENNIFTQNNFVKNRDILYTDGVVLSNQFFLNNFIDNNEGVMVIQSYDLQEPSSPSWNNGTVGNYYSDYQSKYPLAREIGETGTYDTNYTIINRMVFVNAERFYQFYDNHPLVNPVNITQPPAATPSWQVPTEAPTNSFAYTVDVTVIVLLAAIMVSLLLFRRHRKTAMLRKLDRAQSRNKGPS